MHSASVALKFPVTPVATPWSEGYWASLARGELAIQSCEDCGTLEHPPTVCCPACGSFRRGWRPVSGGGTIYTFTICHHAVHPALESLVPYNAVVIELDEGPRLLTALAGDQEIDLSSLIGRRVQIEVASDDALSLPVARLVEP